MRLAWETGSKRIQVETDCLVIVNWLRGIEEVNTSFATIIQECRDWMERQWVIVIQHLRREGNVVVDAMVKMALKIQQGVLKTWHNPLEDMSEILQ